METDEKQCIECGITIHGRVDKKFCSDSCRNAYNNKSRLAETALMQKINNILKRNRQILKELTPEGKAKTSLKKLMELGFSFEYHTSTYTTKTGNTYYFCYEYGYLALEDNKFALVKKIEEL